MTADDPLPVPSGFLGLAPDEATLAGRFFAQAANAMGIDGEAVFARLEAGRTLGEALSLPAGVADVLYGRAFNWFNAGRLDRAESLFRAVCVLDPRVADAWVGFAVCLKGREAWDEAAWALAAAAALRPDWAIPHFHAFELEMRRARWPEARDHRDAFEARAGAEPLPDGVREEVARLAAALERQTGRERDGFQR